jgi:hypothetical protein
MRMTMDRLSDREYSERLAHLTGSALKDEEFCPLSQAEIERLRQQLLAWSRSR